MMMAHGTKQIDVAVELLDIVFTILGYRVHYTRISCSRYSDIIFTPKWYPGIIFTILGYHFHDTRISCSRYSDIVFTILGYHFHDTRIFRCSAWISMIIWHHFARHVLMRSKCKSCMEPYFTRQVNDNDWLANHFHRQAVSQQPSPPRKWWCLSNCLWWRRSQQILSSRSLWRTPQEPVLT